jgi:predicted Zn-dependent protease
MKTGRTLPPRLRRRQLLSVLIAAAALGTLSLGGAACKGRFGNMISRSQEVDLGRQAQRDVERKYKIEDDPAVNARMGRIAARIFPQARRDYDVPYEVRVIDSKEVNAFALPGGPIYFYRGLIELAGSDDEIAAVLGHEAAHVSKRHSARQISDAQAKGTIASILTQGKSDLVQVLANIGLTLDQLRYSRGDESESDRVGFRYLTEAGYDPDAMASFFRKMQEKAGRGGPEWLASHPLTRKRVEQAEKMAADYKQGRGDGGVAR